MTGRALAGKTVLITGATDGLGRALALDLAASGARLLVHGRDRGRCDAVITALIAAGAADPAALVCDFCDLAGIAGLARDVRTLTATLDVLVNNAGIGITKVRCETSAGVELTLQVNALAGDLLARALLPLLAASHRARIVSTVSAGQWPLDLADLETTRGWKGAIAYGRSKLAQIMLGFDLARRTSAAGITVNAVHPASLMPTKLVLGIMEPRSTLASGVASLRRAIEDPELDQITGRYFNEMTEARANDQAYDVEVVAVLRRHADQIAARLGMGAIGE
jgi:NAD(P)-dependent dehydrogenase (short-subunit alcohol dehydrogenase family)